MKMDVLVVGYHKVKSSETEQIALHYFNLQDAFRLSQIKSFKHQLISVWGLFGNSVVRNNTCKHESER